MGLFLSRYFFCGVRVLRIRLVSQSVSARPGHTCWRSLVFELLRFRVCAIHRDDFISFLCLLTLSRSTYLGLCLC